MGFVAQSVRGMTFNREVEGSSPRKRRFFFFFFSREKKINTIFELRIRIVLHFKKPKRCNACDYVVKGEVEGVAYRDCARANVISSGGGVGGVRPYAR